MPGKRKWKVILTFPSATQAMYMEAEAHKAGLPGRLIPVPREISAGCGLAWASPQDWKEEVLGLARLKRVIFEGTYELLL